MQVWSLYLEALSHPLDVSICLSVRLPVNYVNALYSVIFSPFYCYFWYLNIFPDKLPHSIYYTSEEQDLGIFVCLFPLA